MQSELILPGEFIHKLDEKHKSGAYTHTIDGEIRASCMGSIKTYNLDGVNVVDIVPIRKPGVVPSTGSVVLAKVTSLSRRVVRCDVVAVGDQPLAGPFRGLIRREDIRATQRDQAEPSQSYRPGDLVRARVLNLLGPGANPQLLAEELSEVQDSPSQMSTLLAAQAVSASVSATSDASTASATALCLLTTAEPDLGVVLGLGRSPNSPLVDLLGSTGGSPLVPVAWTEMICPNTLTRFPRKVARVPGELLTQLVRVDGE